MIDLEESGFTKKEGTIVEKEVTYALLTYLKQKFPNSTIYIPESFQKKLYSWTNIDVAIAEMDGIIEIQNSETSILCIVEAKHDTTLRKVERKIKQLESIREYFKIIKKILDQDQFQKYIIAERNKRTYISDNAKCQKNLDRKNSNVEKVRERKKEIESLLNKEQLTQLSFEKNILNYFSNQDMSIDPRFLVSVADRIIKGHNLSFDEVRLYIGGPHWTDEKKIKIKLKQEKVGFVSLNGSRYSVNTNSAKESL